MMINPTYASRAPSTRGVLRMPVALESTRLSSLLYCVGKNTAGSGSLGHSKVAPLLLDRLCA